MYSTQELDERGDSIQPWHTPFPISNHSVVPYLVFTVAWPAYRFHRRQARQSGIPISWKIFHNLLWSTQSQCGRPGFNPWVGKISWRRKWQPTPVFLPGKSHGWRSLLGYSSWGWQELDTTEWLHFHFHTVKGFSIVSEAVDIFLEFCCFFYDPVDVGSLISGSSAFSKSNLYIWKFLVHILLKPSLKDFEHYLASMWNECSCAVVWTLFGLVFWGDRNENWPFPVLWPLSFPDLLAYWVQHFNSIIL